MKRIYLDSAAGPANPSSIHQEGVAAARQLNEARRAAAGVLSVSPAEVFFTAGGTESNNLAILGVVRFVRAQGLPAHVITTQIEHHSVLEPVRALERAGVKVTYLPVNQAGLVKPKELAQALRPETVLVSVMLANNEIGTIQPLKEISKVLKRWRLERKTPFPYLHSDACQGSLYLDLQVPRLGIDLLTLNSAKLGQAAAAGLLYVRRGITLEPLIYGGGQENGLRSGTENIVAITNFAAALTKAQAEREKISGRVTKLRDYFINKLLKLPGVKLNGSPSERLPNNVNVSFSGCEAEQIVLELDARGVAASAGSACSQPTGDTSYVLLALGASEAEAASAVRFSLSPQTKKAGLNYVLKSLPPILAKLRGQRL